MRVRIDCVSVARTWDLGKKTGRRRTPNPQLLIPRSLSRRAFTFVEVMMVVTLSALVMTGIIYMVQQGGSHLDSSTWYRENLTKLQIAMNMVTEDLQKASNVSRFAWNATKGINEIQEITTPFLYQPGKDTEMVPDPDTLEPRSRRITRAGKPGDGSEQKLFSFCINHLGSIRKTTDPSWTMLVNAWLKEDRIEYERIFKGMAPPSVVGAVPHYRRTIVSNVDYVVLEATNIPSELDPSIVSGSMLKFMIRLKDANAPAKRAEGRTLFMNRSVRLAVPARDDSGL